MLGIHNADSAEHGDPNATYVVTAISCSLPQGNPGDPKLVGQNRVHVLPGTRLAEIMGAGDHEEGFFCNYAMNEEFRPRFEAAGLKVSAVGPEQEIRAMELTSHPFYVASLFQPQLASHATGTPHPLIQAYLRAAAEQAGASAA